MKRIRILCLFFALMIVVTSVNPALAQDQGPKDPRAEVARVETFEVVKNISAKEYTALNPETASVVAAASGCKGYTLGRKGYSGDGVHIWTYSWTINWCYNGTTITSISQYPTVWANYFWRFVRHIANTPSNPSGGVGKTSYSHYAQGEFCFFQTYSCLSYSYPWVNQTVKGNGTYSGSAGGD